MSKTFSKQLLRIPNEISIFPPQNGREEVQFVHRKFSEDNFNVIQHLLICKEMTNYTYISKINYQSTTLGSLRAIESPPPQNGREELQFFHGHFSENTLNIMQHLQIREEITSYIYISKTYSNQLQDSPRAIFLPTTKQLRRTKILPSKVLPLGAWAEKHIFLICY